MLQIPRFSSLSLGLSAVLAACSATPSGTIPNAGNDAAVSSSDTGANAGSEAGASSDATSTGADATGAGSGGDDSAAGEASADDATPAGSDDSGTDQADASGDAYAYGNGPVYAPCPASTMQDGMCNSATDTGNCSLRGYGDAGRIPYCFCVQYATDARWACRSECLPGVQPNEGCDPLNAGIQPAGASGCLAQFPTDAGIHDFVCLCIGVIGNFRWTCVDATALQHDAGN
jgi:hypothetical protein